jgi:copper chaperone CopZ
MQTVTLAIHGMSCAGCAATVQRVIAAVPGVAEASVSLEERRARVTLDERLASPARIAAAVEAAGFGARPTRP